MDFLYVVIFGFCFSPLLFEFSLGADIKFSAMIRKSGSVLQVDTTLNIDLFVDVFWIPPINTISKESPKFVGGYFRILCLDFVYSTMIINSWKF